MLVLLAASPNSFTHLITLLLLTPNASPNSLRVINPLLFNAEPKWMAECRKEKRDLKKGTLWSEYEDKVLIALWNSGTATQVIADRLGRTHSGVRRRAKNLRLKNKTFGKKWTDRETKMLIKLYNKDMESKDIAAKLGRSKHQIEGKKNRLRQDGIIITPYKHHGGVKKASNAIARKTMQNVTMKAIGG